MVIKHNSQDIDFRKPFGSVQCGTLVKLSIFIDDQNVPNDVMIRFWYNNKEELYKMKLSRSKKKGFHYTISINMPTKPQLVWYYFIINSGDKVYYYGNNKANLGGEGDIYNVPPESFQITVYKENFTTPEWFKNSVMYQVFTDRFFNGSGYVEASRNDYVIHTDWNEPVNIEKPDDNSDFNKNDFYGGDLLGIIKKLEYFKDLGITTIYLNPIFEAYSNHKYDTANYKKIDPMFGNEEIFSQLCSEAQKLGIKIVLDGVFSHTGSDSIYFNKNGYYDSVGAYQSKESEFYNWFIFSNYPDDYKSWWGIKSLPNTNENDPSFKEYILTGKDSVIKHWLEAGASGWRLDVADELPSDFLKDLRIEVKKTDPNAIIIGEVWEDASHKVSYGEMRDYLLGNELDTVMNYPFKKCLISFVLNMVPAEALHQEIMSLYENYPIHCFYSLMNLLGSHDIARIKTVFGEAPDAKNMTNQQLLEYKLPADKVALASKRTKIASVIQMTFPGVPCIYYGDEIGMEGYRDPFNRESFKWNGGDLDLYFWYKKLISLRNEHDVFRTGSFIPLYFEDSVYVYARYIGKMDVFNNPKDKGFAIVAVNVSLNQQKTVTLNLKKWGVKHMKNMLDSTETLSASEGQLEIILPPLSSKVLMK